MRLMKNRALALGMFALALGCSSDGTTEPQPDVTLSVAPTSFDLLIGEKRTVTATLANAANTALTWRSTLPSIASVSATGEITAVATGQTVITAISMQDTTVQANTLVRVTAAGGPISITVLGNVLVSERYTAEVATRDDWAYTTTWGNRGVAGNVVKVWNVAANLPVLRDSLNVTGGVGTIGDVQISDDGTLLVISTESGFGSIRLYSRADPSKPTLLSTFNNANTTRGVHTVKLARISGRHYAFLSINPTPARLVIVDITNPAAPFEVFMQVMGRPYIHDVHIRDGLLYTALWHDGMSIFDIGGGGRGGTPSAPVLISNIPTVSGYIHNIQTYKNPATGVIKYVFLGEEGPAASLSSASGDVHVIDISNITQPRQVAEYSVAGAGTHNFAIDEQSGILYAAYYNGGVRAIDIRGDLGTCTAAQKQADGFCNLVALGREAGTALTSGANYVWGVALQGTKLYASDMKSGIYKLDVSALKRP